MSASRSSDAARPARDADTQSVVGALRVIRERWWVVLASVLACALLAGGLAVARDDVFEASANVLFGQSGPADSTIGLQRETINPERSAATQVLVATSPEVTDRVRKTLGGGLSRSDVLSGLTVEAADNADVLTFVASAGDREGAARIANGFARSYVDLSREADAGQIDQLLRQVEEQIRAAPAGSPERTDLVLRRSTLQSQQAAANGGTRLIGAAEPPEARSSPQPLRDVVLGAILGLILGLAVAFLIDLFDRRVRTVEEFERQYGMRALASIPQLAFSARNQEERSLGFEPYRVLRNALGFVELTQALDVVMITSAMPSEGKSSVALNLAKAIALSGQRVVLVEADLRRPSLARHLGITNPSPGLTTALVGKRPVTELLDPVAAGLSYLSLLPSGPLPPNAAELLRSPRMGQVLAELRAEGVRIVVDAPPLLPVADAQGLLDHPQIDGALVVARVDQTTREEVRRARGILAQHRLQPLGLVVTGTKEEGVYAYYGPEPGAGGATTDPSPSMAPPEPVRR